MRPHILLADDDPFDVELFMRALSTVRPDAHLDVVNDGAAALDYLHRRGRFSQRPAEIPAVVILDIKMPKVGGLDVLRDIRKSDDLRHLPVVMLTSSREAADVATSYDLGSNAFVVKPVDFDAFMQAVGKLVTFWTDINEPPP